MQRSSIALFLSLAVTPAPALAQSAWFGVRPPPPVSLQAPVITGDRSAAPAVVPPGEEGFAELRGGRMLTDLRTIVDFSRRSLEQRELGGDQLWGRVTGFPSGARTIEWATDQLRRAGVPDVELQPFQQDAGASIWLPERWEVALVGDESYGIGSRDIILQSAMPLADVDIAPAVTAEVIFVGTASPAELAHVDVAGRIAVQKITPQGHTVFTRDPAGPRATDLLERGAVAVINILDLPDNVRVNDMGCGAGPCFNIGGRDGLFLESVLSAAALRGATPVRMRVSVTGRDHSGLSAANGVGVIPGSVGGRAMILNAHADAWFDGAGDNGDGLAVLLALARHFAQPANRLQHDLVFVVSAGHHSRGLSGPSSFVALNPDLLEGAAMIVNLEHTSQREIAPARSEFDDGYREWVMDGYEAPIVAGLNPPSPWVESIIEQGIQRYGTNFVAGANTMASGEGGAYVRTGVPVFTTMQGPPLYHTTGETIDMISVPGMERMARFMAWFVTQVDQSSELGFPNP